MFAAIPFLTRLYGPAEIGEYQIALALALILQPAATLRYEYVIPVTFSSSLVRRAVRNSLLSLLISVTFVAILGLILILAGNQTAGSSALMTSVLLSIYSWIAIDNALLVRAGALERLGARNLLSGSVSAVLQVGLALLLPIAWTLVVGVAAGRLVSIVLTQKRQASMMAVGDGLDTTSYTGRRMAATIGSSLLANASTNSLVLLTGTSLGTQSAGHAAMAQRVAGTPASLVSQGLAQVVQVTASRSIAARDGSLWRSLMRVFTRLALASGVVGILILIFGPILAVPVLGPAWEPVGAILAILAPTFALQLIVSPLTPVLVMIHEERALLIQNALRLTVVGCSTAAAAVLSSDLVWTATAYAISMIGMYLLQLATIARLVRRYDKRTGGPGLNPRAST